MRTYLALGASALAGAALFEAALVPGLVIGGLAILAPQLLREPRRRKRRAPSSATPATTVEPARMPAVPDWLRHPETTLARLSIGRAAAKTITFRLIVTSLDFTVNYLVIGELGTAAGLSAIALAAAPVFYFVHETAWNSLSAPGQAVDITRWSPGPTRAVDRGQRITLSRPIAKMITFRTFATVMDFGTNYLFIGDLLTAVGLTAFGFVVGPFVYLGHELVWDRLVPEAQVRERSGIETTPETGRATIIAAQA